MDTHSPVSTLRVQGKDFTRVDLDYVILMWPAGDRSLAARSLLLNEPWKSMPGLQLDITELRIEGYPGNCAIEFQLESNCRTLSYPQNWTVTPHYDPGMLDLVSSSARPYTSTVRVSTEQGMFSKLEKHTLLNADGWAQK